MTPQNVSKNSVFLQHEGFYYQNPPDILHAEVYWKLHFWNSILLILLNLTYIVLLTLIKYQMN